MLRSLLRGIDVTYKCIQVSIALPIMGVMTTNRMRQPSLLGRAAQLIRSASVPHMYVVFFFFVRILNTPQWTTAVVAHRVCSTYLHYSIDAD